MDDAGLILLLLSRARARAARPRIRGISEAAVDRARYTVPHTAHFRQRVRARKRPVSLSGGYPPDARYYAESRGPRERLARSRDRDARTSTIFADNDPRRRAARRIPSG